MVGCLCVAILALYPRLYGVAAPDLTEDEELATGLPRLSYAELLTDIASRPPLVFVAQKALMSVTGGTGALEIRLPSVVAGTAAVIVLFLFAARLCGSGVGLAAALFLAVSQFHVTWSRDGRYYGLLTLSALLFLWCYWELLQYRKLWLLPAVLVAALALPLTHHGGALFLAACAVVAPVVVFAKEWRGWIKAHRSGAVAGAVAVLLCLGVTFPVWRRLARVAIAMAKRGPDAPLPAFFDVSPDFLLNRLAEVTAIPRPYTYVVLVLMALGLAVAARKAPLFGALAASILVVPFVLVWFFRPQHWWHPKYFIFMLPVLAVLLAWGIATIPGLLSALGRRRMPFVLGGRCLSVALFSVVCIANATAVLREIRQPTQDFQEMAAALRATQEVPDWLGFSWKEAWRVLRTYYPLATLDRTVFLDADDVAPWRLDGLPNSWFLHSGKMSKSHAVSAALLSDKLSRAAYLNAFLARGPNLQRIAFGENCPGAPKADGPLQIAPGGTARVEVLFPRAGRRAVLVQSAADPKPPALAFGFGDQAPVPLQGAAGLITATVEVPFGAGSFSLVNESLDTPVTIETVEFLPVFAREPLEIPAWDFYALLGDELLDAVWTDRHDGRLVLRDLRAGHTAYYRFLSAHEGLATIAVSALNDPPGANRYEVFVPGATEAPIPLAFDREDGTISAARTPPVRLRRGVYTICVTYVGVPMDEMRALTRGFRIMTKERMQTAGLAAVAVVSSP